jgi:hypothetical protein
MCIYLLRIDGMINAALEHTAAVTMSCDFNAVFADDVIDELIVFSREAMQAFLDDVVSIQVLDEGHHFGPQCIGHSLDLMAGREVFDESLDSPCPMHA